jgi:hypothetical protein
LKIQPTNIATTEPISMASLRPYVRPDDTVAFSAPAHTATAVKP